MELARCLFLLISWAKVVTDKPRCGVLSAYVSTGVDAEKDELLEAIIHIWWQSDQGKSLVDRKGVVISIEQN